MRSVLLTLTFVVVISTAPASAIDIQEAYDACGSANGYDKYLELDPDETYTGWLIVDSGKDSCIAGNGATIQIDSGKTIRALNSGTKLDIDHTAIYCDGTGWGISYLSGANGTINFCTIDYFMYGVYAWGPSNVTLKNSIVTNNTEYGVAKEEYTPMYISYVDAWGNAHGNYYEYCSG
ncbi:MAG: right-handed parallel beta-helix repeat-containing protein [Candidatus Coatesbacteria bacterium]|nr:MAG: right-handed parallel beta-helix repeat-containing protein [Candidatus Coatesbacteria bacterium]